MFPYDFSLTIQNSSNSTKLCLQDSLTTRLYTRALGKHHKLLSFRLSPPFYPSPFIQCSSSEVETPLSSTNKLFINENKSVYSMTIFQFTNACTRTKHMQETFC